MKKKIPDQLARKQEQQRQETVNRIMWALDTLESMGMEASVRNLVAVSGLSHSVFYKPHVKKFIAEYCPGVYVLSDDEEEEDMPERTPEEETEIARLTSKLEALERENEYLRGKVFLLLKGKNE